MVVRARLPVPSIHWNWSQKAITVCADMCWSRLLCVLQHGLNVHLKTAPLSRAKNMTFIRYSDCEYSYFSVIVCGALCHFCHFCCQNWFYWLFVLVGAQINQKYWGSIFPTPRPHFMPPFSKRLALSWICHILTILSYTQSQTLCLNLCFWLWEMSWYMLEWYWSGSHLENPIWPPENVIENFFGQESIT